MKRIALLTVSLVWLAGCGRGDVNVQTEEDYVTQARQDYPRFIDLQVDLFQNTCSPNPGVCHQTNNYPDLQTSGSLLSLVNAPCNVEIPDATQGWDGCELPADTLSVGGLTTRVSWIEPVGMFGWLLELEDAAPTSNVYSTFTVTDAAGALVFQPPSGFPLILTTTQGSNQVTLDVLAAEGIGIVQPVIDTIVGGDANKNGIYGADDPSVVAGALLVPGDLEASYLWGRITGTVPGTRMPLANGPVVNPQYVALACWIEGLTPGATANDAIDYDACAFAAHPEDLEITSF